MTDSTTQGPGPADSILAGPGPSLVSRLRARLAERTCVFEVVWTEYDRHAAQQVEGVEVPKSLAEPATPASTAPRLVVKFRTLDPDQAATLPAEGVPQVDLLDRIAEAGGFVCAWLADTPDETTDDWQAVRASMNPGDRLNAAAAVINFQAESEVALVPKDPS